MFAVSCQSIGIRENNVYERNGQVAVGAAYIAACTEVLP